MDNPPNDIKITSKKTYYRQKRVNFDVRAPSLTSGQSICNVSLEVTGWSCLRKVGRPAGPIRCDDGTAGDQVDVGASSVGVGPKVEAYTAFKSDALILLQFVGRLAAGGSGG